MAAAAASPDDAKKKKSATTTAAAAPPPDTQIIRRTITATATPDEEKPWKTDEARFLAYLSRAKMVLVRAVKANIRYAAYSSDVGEALRPVVPGWVVNSFYLVSFGYVGGDVAYTGYLERERKSSDMMVARQCTETAIFQLIASLAIPTAVIHTAVHQTHTALKKWPKAPPTVARWGPSAVGMVCMPFLPLVDEPVERATEYVFDQFWPAEEGWRRRHEELHEKAHAEEAAKAAQEQAKKVK